MKRFLDRVFRNVYAIGVLDCSMARFYGSLCCRAEFGVWLFVFL